MTTTTASLKTMQPMLRNVLGTTEFYCTDLNLYFDAGSIELEDAVYSLDYEFEPRDPTVGEPGGWKVNAELVSFMLGGRKCDRYFAIEITCTAEVEEQESRAALEYAAVHLDQAA